MTKTASQGKVIALEYTLTLKHNQVVDTNAGKIPLIYRQGAHHILPGVESAVAGMTVEQTKQVIVAPKDGATDREIRTCSMSFPRTSFLKTFMSARSFWGAGQLDDTTLDPP
jgi:FKBP-type peptidyl-prolyl cis-trans isomerase 2